MGAITGMARSYKVIRLHIALSVPILYEAQMGNPIERSRTW